MSVQNTPDSSRSASVFLGGPTVLTVLLALCLCCFALLTWYRARMDYSYAQRSAQTVQEYYAADSRCDQLLSQLAALSVGIDAYEAGYLMEAALLDEGLSPLWEPFFWRLTFTLPVGAQGELQIVLSPGEDDAPWETISRRILSQDEAAEGETLPVFQFPDF